MSARIIFVSSAPGRAGADTMIRACEMLAGVSCAPNSTRALIACATKVTVLAAGDNESYLPRRAAEVFSEFVSRVRAIDTLAADYVLAECRAVSMFVPVYGELYMPTSRPTRWWTAFIRSAIVRVLDIGDDIQVIKVGPTCSVATTVLLEENDRYVFVVRHPASLVQTLTESAVDGMRPSEAVTYVDIALGHAKKVLSTLGDRSNVVRLEDLCDSPTQTLTDLAMNWDPSLDIAASSLTPERFSAALPKDVTQFQDWEHPNISPFAERLGRLSREWGY